MYGVIQEALSSGAVMPRGACLFQAYTANFFWNYTQVLWQNIRCKFGMLAGMNYAELEVKILLFFRYFDKENYVLYKFVDREWIKLYMYDILFNDNKSILLLLYMNIQKYELRFYLLIHF